jgi:tellurite resistance protein
MVRLDPERRDKILAMLRNNKRMPEAVRNRLIKQFEKDEVLEEVLDRIESRMASTQSEDTQESVKITPDQRRAMIAFVKANKNIPEETKINVLERLKQDRIPRAMFERLSRNSGI